MHDRATYQQKATQRLQQMGCPSGALQTLFAALEAHTCNCDAHGRQTQMPRHQRVSCYQQPWACHAAWSLMTAPAAAAAVAAAAVAVAALADPLPAALPPAAAAAAVLAVFVS